MTIGFPTSLAGFWKESRRINSATNYNILHYVANEIEHVEKSFVIWPTRRDAKYSKWQRLGEITVRCSVTGVTRQVCGSWDEQIRYSKEPQYTLLERRLHWDWEGTSSEKPLEPRTFFFPFLHGAGRQISKHRKQGAVLWKTIGLSMMECAHSFNCFIFNTWTIFAHVSKFVIHVMCP